MNDFSLGKGYWSKMVPCKGTIPSEVDPQDYEMEFRTREV